jgi:hypothetical protein
MLAQMALEFTTQAYYEGDSDGRKGMVPSRSVGAKARRRMKCEGEKGMNHCTLLPVPRRRVWIMGVQGLQE